MEALCAVSKISSRYFVNSSLSCWFQDNLIQPLSNAVHSNGGMFGNVCASAKCVHTKIPGCNMKS